MSKQASLKRYDSGGDGFKVTKQTQLTAKQKKTTMEELASPLPVATTTLQKLKKFKFPAKGPSGTVSQNPRDAKRVAEAESGESSQELQQTKRCRVTEYDQRFVEQKMQSLNCDGNTGPSDIGGIESQTAFLDELDENYLASDEESLPSQVLKEILGKPKDNVKNSASSPVLMDLTDETSGRPTPADSSEETSQYFSQTPHNDKINDTLPKEVEGLVPGTTDQSARKNTTDDEDEYGSDIDMDYLITEEDLNMLDADQGRDNDEEDDEYDGGDADINEAIMNSPMELAKESPMTESKSESTLADESDYGGAWDEGILDADNEIEFLGTSARTGPSVIAKPAQQVDKPVLKSESDAQTAPFKPKIVKEIASPDGSNLYSYKPVDKTSGNELQAPMIESTGFSLMPASAFEIKQNKQVSKMTAVPTFEKTEPRIPAKRPAEFEVVIDKRIRGAPLSSPPVRPTGKPTAPSFGKPNVIDLTSDTPPSGGPPDSFHQSMKAWINKSEPLESAQTSAPSIRLPATKTTVPKPKILCEEPPSSTEEDEDEDEDPIPVTRSYRKKPNNRIALQTPIQNGDDGFGKFNTPKGYDDGYTLPPYSNMKFIPDWKVKRYFEIISTPPSPEALKKNIVDTRPPPERPMNDTGKRETFFKLTNLMERYNERKLGRKAMLVELFVRVVQFKTIWRGHEVLLTDLRSSKLKLKGIIPPNKIPADSLAWARDIQDLNGQPAAIAGSVSKVDGELFVHVTHMVPRTWPEIAERYLMVKDL